VDDLGVLAPFSPPTWSEK